MIYSQHQAFGVNGTLIFVQNDGKEKNNSLNDILKISRIYKTFI